ADRSGGGAAVSWLWTFGDGESSTQQNPSHVFAAAGSYPVTLRVSNSGGTTQTTQVVEVAQEDTLRLLSAAGHTFEVTLSARDPRTGNQGEGLAIPQNDVFGYFTIPALVPTNPGAPLVPEVFVKMLDARAIAGQDFWFFWGGLTDLDYTMTVRDTVRGTVKVYHNPVTGSPACLGADTAGFATAGTPTRTATSAAPTATPSRTPTPTPTAAAAQTRMVSVQDFSFRDQVTGNSSTTINVGDTVQWNWVGGFHTVTSGNCCSGDGKWASGGKGSGSFSHTFTAADRGMTFPYFCEIHGSIMTGVIHVNP
ncbi:MAG TPA: PKD domain-containing protein, partial [Thermoanaerobaculia bacterium]|nr:PKD domain-containing protein [Thermoanaerobaculia bacterium]